MEGSLSVARKAISPAAATAAAAADVTSPSADSTGTPATAAAPAAAAAPPTGAVPAAAASPAAALAAASPSAAAIAKCDPVSADSKSAEAVVSGFDQEWAELQKLQDLQEDAEFGSLLQPGEGAAADSAAAAAAAATDADKRSVYVGNVDYSATPADLQEHFKGCGQINRITIMVDKFTGHPKGQAPHAHRVALPAAAAGYAYIEFTSEVAAQHAVVSKRKNIPGMSRGRGGGWRPRGGPLPFRGRWVFGWHGLSNGGGRGECRRQWRRSPR
ncbi:polyadenylate-binding protein 2 [Cyclospora cayetanensis]|uniref:Polyadenylate-binding protein 2 n=1 Tax=Cyclospora cayetanensis TaxID=88456 RepID=A0A6P6RWG5_9EIME|nr:polyadenylate-binding protein 2 [Cyclospora cayetanensis]